MRSVLTQALLLMPEFAEMLDKGDLAVLSVGQLPRATTYDELVIPTVLNSKSTWALRAAIAPRMTIVSYGIEVPLQNWCLREVGLLDIREGLAERSGAAAAHEADFAQSDNSAASESSVDALLLDLRSLVADEEEERSTLDAPRYEVGPRREIVFEDGSVAVVGDSAILQIISDESEPIKEKRAKDVKRHELVLVTNGSVLHDLFEVLRDKVDAQTTLSRAIEIVKSFQHALSASFLLSELSIEQLHQKLREDGSAIVNAGTVSEWVEGRRFGPSDQHDIKRLGIALDVEAFVRRHRELYASMQKVRIAHRELGRALVLLVKTAYRTSDTTSISLTVDGEYVVLYDVIDAIAIKRVVDVREM